MYKFRENLGRDQTQQGGSVLLWHFNVTLLQLEKGDNGNNNNTEVVM